MEWVALIIVIVVMAAIEHATGYGSGDFADTFWEVAKVIAVLAVLSIFARSCLM